MYFKLSQRICGVKEPPKPADAIVWCCHRYPAYIKPYNGYRVKANSLDIQLIICNVLSISAMLFNVLT